MKTAKEKLRASRAQMKEQGVNGFIIPRADEYQGEFVAPYAERLKWLTGFTGSGGVAAVLENKACAMTDGRYLIQIKEQVDAMHFDTGDMTKTPIEEWIKNNSKEGDVIGYDPWLHTPAQIEKMEKSGLTLKALDKNPLDEVWEDQPERPKNTAFDFPEKLAGRSSEDKKQDITKALKEKGADACILTLPDSICWLLNIRGSDTDFIPQKLCYLLLNAEDASTQEVTSAEDLSALKDKTVLLDPKRSPIWFKHALENIGANIIDCDDPCIAPKAIKTNAEQAAIKKAHELDGAAMVKFLCWLDKTAHENLSEISASDKLEEFRNQNPAFKGNSFPAIAGFGENGAIIHYRATPETNKEFENNNLFLLDSGGQYLNENQGVAGTTDITRTIAIGEPTEDMKRHFSLVLKGHIAVANARFPKSATGAQIDAFARQALWQEDLNFAHGTGHGVGCFLAVHEEATSISSRSNEPFKPGMLISNEPGYYLEGSYGIRIENLILTHEDGESLCFETISLAPIDSRLIAVEMLSEEEKNWFNAYHAKVREKLSPYIDDKDQDWLKEKTSAI